jgi:hypothetical protein
MKASGLRIEAICAIAREQGVKIEDVQSRCIDENLLEELANAQVRRLKSYFNNTKRHISDLNGADIRAFVDFCTTFKKRHINQATGTWEDIDTDAIRQQFLKKVHNSTPTLRNRELHRSFAISILEQLLKEREYSRTSNIESDIPNQLLEVTLRFLQPTNSGYSPSYSLNNTENLKDYLHKEAVINQVIQSHWYYAKPVRVYHTLTDQRSFVKRVTISARYYIFTDDDEEFLCDTKPVLPIRASKEVA